MKTLVFFYEKLVFFRTVPTSVPFSEVFLIKGGSYSIIYKNLIAMNP